VLRKFKIKQSQTRITVSLHEGLWIFMIMSRWLPLRMANVSDKFVAKTKTHILCIINFSRKLCRLWDNEEKCVTARRNTDNNIIWRMRTACWITKAMEIHSEYVKRIAFLRQQMLHLKVMLHVNYLACWMLTLLIHIVTTGFKWINSLQSSFLLFPRIIRHTLGYEGPLHSTKQKETKRQLDSTDFSDL
jgi:hypothetical protein